ncbi:hypothetical protein QYF36_006383 [Acer negundo]|nr:hypothetical protein QYF36_006383 [Acer negundo]
MAAANIWSVSLKQLDDAFKSRTREQITMIGTNGKPLNLAAQTWPDIALIIAYNLIRINIILVIGSIIPELSCEKIEGGYTVLHLACILGDYEMVRALVGLRFDRLHYQKDHKFSTTPLQMAVVHGHVDVILLLLSACPDSIEELTPEKLTVFHLAVECYLPEVFAVLWREAKKLNKDYLLDRVDCLGNSLLHCAVLNNQLRIVKMCLTDLSSTGHDFAISWVNAKNIEGDTAMDLYHKIPDPDFETRQIGRILHEASHPDQLYLFSHGDRRRSNSTGPSWQALETKTDHLAVLAIFIGLSFAVICALPTFFPKEDRVTIAPVFEFRDVVYGKLPLIFYSMFFITVLFTTSISFLLVLLYSLPCRILMLLGGISTFFLYLLLTHNVMPKFCVRTGSHHLFPSYYFMWLLVLVFIVIGALIIHLGNCLTMRFCNHAKGVRRKVASIFRRPPCTEMLPLRNLSFGA